MKDISALEDGNTQIFRGKRSTKGSLSSKPRMKYGNRSGKFKSNDTYVSDQGNFIAINL